MGLNRSSYYRESIPGTESPENLLLMRLIDAQYLETPFYGSRRMAAWLCRQGYDVNRKRAQRLMRIIGIEGVGPKPGTSKPSPDHEVYPYLLRHVEILRPNQVWSTDITYCRMLKGFMYLVAVIDWYSRRVLSWEVSNTLDASFCIEALMKALERGQPEVFNTDQGSQFTSRAFLAPLKERNIQISMDGRGRALDNIFVERLWRSLKYEWLYFNEYESVPAFTRDLREYLEFYNTRRLHSSLGYRTPEEVYFENQSSMTIV